MGSDPFSYLYSLYLIDNKEYILYIPIEGLTSSSVDSKELPVVGHHH